MKIILEFSLIPLGVGISLSKYVAECVRILEQAGLRYELHANGTNVEGDWDEVFAAIRSCHETLHEQGVPRISTVIKVGTRTDRLQTMEQKKQSVRARLPG